MKRNFNVKLVALNGAQLVQLVPSPENKQAADAEGKPLFDKTGAPVLQQVPQNLVASDLICTALLTPFNDEQPSAEEKHKRFKLAQRINAVQMGAVLEGASIDASIVEITAEEATLLKLLCGKMFAPLIVGQIIDLIES